MGIFNQQPNYNQSYTTGKRGITGPQGPPGPKGDKGVGFNLTSDGKAWPLNLFIAKWTVYITILMQIQMNRFITIHTY